ncbi:alpha-(1-_3)-arabinofuranosyltransferase domain-containing protein [Actinomadura alba]|uniref:DUF3367 domain-containing protein n=1 Tax=Actinomadura alba TaxID=406431 RepID=A0ABR7LJE6_9ACTN|nr:alpha-(1->3)-arabinofuranosyltransferase family protein [Actinomadura alba]MBC6464918.1 DUF3367 domain-containing protein [Actinomadura alba]
METRGSAPEERGGVPAEERTSASLRDRLQVVVCCLALTCLATSTRPGRILADTKIDMPVDPLAFLGRALHLWAPEQFGQLQNQAVGYLFPMGPVYVLGDLADLPAWITQRVWLAMLLCVAFLGARRLAGWLGIGGSAGGLVAGMVYALAPTGLAALGQISSDYLPFAMAPWIVLPLITAVHDLPERGGRGRLIVKSVARSGLAVACCGGINATATAAVLVVPLIYLLTRPRGTPRLRVLACWSVSVALATFWWLVPLILTARYGFSWLTYTEKAVTTTGPTGLVTVLRGAERWVSYLVLDGQVWWPVGHALSLSVLPVLCTGVVAALGLAGLVRAGLPERAFLLITLLAGLAIITAGHISTIEGPAAAPMRELLDGPLAALRNLHRFDVIVRLPIALGVAHLIGSVRRPQVRLRMRAVAFTALGGIALAAVSNGLSGPGDFREPPTYWRDAANWLSGRTGGEGVLAIPGAPFGEYLWGRPMDDIMQPLVTSRWGVRQLVPDGSPGYTRALDAIDRQVAAGRRSPGLAQFLSRMGIRYVLVRNDLRREGLRGVWPARLHQALDGSPGIRRVASFGTQPVGWAEPDDAIGAFDQLYPPLEMYEVEAADQSTGAGQAQAVTATAKGGAVTLADADSAIRLYGSPESLLTLADNGALRGRQVLLNDDAPGSGGTPVVSDSLRLVKRNFGELDQGSPTLTGAERGEAADVVEPGWERYATVAAFSGVSSITASTSAADADAIPQLHDAGRLPYSAMDGDPWTYWETGGWNGPVGQWLGVRFDRPTVPGRVSATFVRNENVLGPPPSRIAVETEAGRIVQPVVSSSAPQVLRVPPGRTGWLRIRILRLAEPVASPLLARAGISELTIDGVRAGRRYELPAARDAGVPSSFVMTRASGAAPACMKGSKRWVCSPALERRDEEGAGFERSFLSAAPGQGALSGLATLTDDRLIQGYTGIGSRVRVAVSSSLSSDPALLARSAFDADPATTWIAAEHDLTPRFAVSWGRAIRVGRVDVERPAGARGALRVRVRSDRGDSREGLLDRNGRLTFAPMIAKRLILEFTVSGQLALQITDITVPGVAPLPVLGRLPLELPCGFGPWLEVNGVKIPTRVSGAMDDLLEGQPLRYESCRSAQVIGGTNHLRPSPFSPYRIESAVLDVDGSLRPAQARSQAGAPEGTAPEQATTREVRVERWSPDARELRVEASRRSFLVVNENYNRGWRATVGTTVLRPVRLDGWKQGWVVPAGTAGTVELTYLPGRVHRVAVPAGLGLLAVLALAACGRGGSRAVPRPVPRRIRGVRWTALPLAAGLGFWVAGGLGVAVALGSSAVFAAAPLLAAPPGSARRRRTLARALASPWSVAVLMFAGTVSWAASASTRSTGNPAALTDPLGDLVPQLLGLVIVGRLVIALWTRRPGPGRVAESASRSGSSSTSRR